MHQFIHCFLIDDDADDHEIFRFALDENGMQVRCDTALSGADALAMLDADPDFNPDFIFLDINMTKMDGMECLVKLRQIPRLLHTPIIMYSTSRSPVHQVQSMELGATNFLIKPVDISELARAIKKIFTENQAKKQS